MKEITDVIKFVVEKYYYEKNFLYTALYSILFCILS